MESGFFENTGKDQGRRRGEGKKKVRGASKKNQSKLGFCPNRLFHDKVLFLAVQNSSIGDLVTDSLTHSGYFTD